MVTPSVCTVALPLLLLVGAGLFLIARDVVEADVVINVPNAISALRILMVPILALLAFRGWGRAFTLLLASSLLLDFVDGYLARRLKQQTLLGAQLDSWGDFLTVLVYPAAAVWLQPVLLRQNALWVTLAALAYVGPITFGVIKFRRLTSYHTRLMTVSARTRERSAITSSISPSAK